MRLLIAALAITFTIAIGASVVATWASVADAPWEDDPPVAAQPVDRTEEIRREAALSRREIMVQNRRDLPYDEWQRRSDQADREIDRYC